MTALNTNDYAVTNIFDSYSVGTIANNEIGRWDA